MKTKHFLSIACILTISAMLGNAYAQHQVGITTSEESFPESYGGKVYSPYAQRSFPDQVFWGDTHLHTGLSMDAGLFGARLGLDDAYRFARGEAVMASRGQPVRPGRPLGWPGLADHSDCLGFFTDLAARNPPILLDA